MLLPNGESSRCRGQPVTRECLFHALLRIRRVEEEIERIYPSDKVRSPVHLSVGQEAVSVGVCAALEPQDVVFGTYRSHALYLAKGGDLNAMTAELFGKVDGCARGKGGSMHLVDIQAGVMGTSAIVASSVPHAVGYAYGLRLQCRASVVACFFGEGAVEEGVFWESLNFAALKHVPVVFVCENNRYAIHSHQDERQAVPDICARVEAAGVPAKRVAGDDVLRIYEAARAAVSAVRERGEGPRFIEVLTYRWRRHVGPGEDFDAGYRSRAEAEPWFARDPVRRLATLLSERDRRVIETEVENEINAAFAFAEASPLPDPAELYSDVFDSDNPGRRGA